MFLTIVNCWLVALEGGLLTIAISLVPFLGHIYVNSMMALTSFPIDRETMMPSAVL